MNGCFKSMVEKIVILCFMCFLMISFSSPFALAKDKTKPSVTSFNVSPSSITEGDTVKIKYSVKDSGGSYLKQVELWRSKDDKNHWKEVKKDSISGKKNSASGSFSDKPSPDGKYYYGLHVVDKDGNWGSEKSAQSVTVKAHDKTKPVIKSFSVTPQSVSLGGGSFSISYNVSDSGGSGLKQVELWRAKDSGGSPSGWDGISTRKLSGNGPALGSFNDVLSDAGAYWYGLHVVDNAGNWVSEPSPLKVTVTAATDKASLVKDTIPDNTKVTGGSSFKKTWTIKNTGTSKWTSSYKLRYVSNTAGRLSSISEVKISGTVSPGNTYTFTVPMKAPATQTSEKAYREDWKFTNPSGSTINVGASSTLWALIKVPGTVVVGGWSNETGYHHAETTKQKSIVAAALNGGNNRPSPQSIVGSPWQTDTDDRDGDRMRAAIQDVKDYWIANGRPSLPLQSIPANVQSIMRKRLSATYPLAQQNAFIERIRQVFNGTAPTADNATLAYLGIRAQCKEFADRTVKAGGGIAKTYNSSTVANTSIRPGMYAFKYGNGHAAIIVAVYWDANGKATQLRLAEANWCGSAGFPSCAWANPIGQVPWNRIITTGRAVPISDYYVVTTE